LVKFKPEIKQKILADKEYYYAHNEDLQKEINILSQEITNIKGIRNADMANIEYIGGGLGDIINDLSGNNTSDIFINLLNGFNNRGQR
jgi:hypothetical protein